MSYYSDAEDSLKSFEDVSEDGLRKRKIWDPDTESITSEIKDLLEEDVNSLVNSIYPLVKLNANRKLIFEGRRRLHRMPFTFDA